VIEVLLRRLIHPSVEARDVHRYRMPGRLIYVIHHSYPYSSDGYAVRTHGIASALVQKGYSVVAINRPGNPWDLPGFEASETLIHKDIDGVRYLYLRTPNKKHSGSEYREAAVDVLKELFRLFKPEAVMAASDWETALPAAIAAKELDLPFFYEVRGFWEISRISREPEWRKSAQYRHSVQMETEVLKAADHVFTLTRFMKEEMVRRGIKAEKISLIPNGYWHKSVDHRNKTKLSRTDLGCNTQYVVSYIGAFSELEGLEELVHACALLRKENLDLSLLLVGSSSVGGLNRSSSGCYVSRNLKRLADTLDFADYLLLPGRIHPEELADYYALIDLVVIPRKSLPVCKLVSPLKPLEAAANSKAMLLSDVPPLKEIMEEANVLACFQAGNVEDLALKIKSLVTNRGRLDEIGKAYFQWVTTSRSWSKVLTSFTNVLSIPQKRRKVSDLENLLKGA
jgi:glycosyltransferase involved in cell wall biosynthesis